MAFKNRVLILLFSCTIILLIYFIMNPSVDSFRNFIETAVGLIIGLKFLSNS